MLDIQVIANFEKTQAIIDNYNTQFAEISSADNPAKQNILNTIKINPARNIKVASNSYIYISKYCNGKYVHISTHPLNTHKLTTT